MRETMEQLGGDLFVRKATLEYAGSARYDDVLDVGIRCARVGNSSMLFSGAVFRQEQLLVSCELVYVFADAHAQGSQPVPAPLRQVLEAFEAGQSMVDVRTGSWGELGADAGPIRTEVFVQEQRIPADMEWDDADAHGVHAVAYNRFGLALGTGRLLEHVPGVAKIGRMAVRQSARGSRIGLAVLDALLQAGRQRGDREALLHAQLGAASFYERAGFVARGPVFVEAGIPHVEMVRTI